MQHRIRCAWSAFAKHRRGLTSQSYSLRHRLHLFDAVVTPTVTYCAGTWATTDEYEQILHTTQRRKLRHIIQKNEKKKKTKTKKTWKKDVRDDETSEDIQEGDSTHDENDQDSSYLHSMMMGTARPVRGAIQRTGLDAQKESAGEARGGMLTYDITNWVETQKKLKWRQALRIATQRPDRWTRKAAEWNPGLIISTKTQMKAGRRANRWEDDLNEFEKDDETVATESNDLKNNNTWLLGAKKFYEWEKKERQYTKHVIDD